MFFALLDRFFPATCPVDISAKRWLEFRLSWLADEFGPQCLDADQPIIEPTPAFFPDRYDGSQRAVRAMVARICPSMGVDPDCIHLDFFTENRNLQLVNGRGQPLAGAAGLYEDSGGQFTIRLETSQFDDPMSLVGTIAHELAHVRLLGEHRIPFTVYDNELLTDLTAVFHGFGIFLANIPRNWDSQTGRWPVTNLKKPEYMSPPMYGHALAHLAWFRGERNPIWRKHLGSGAKANFDQAQRYLRETGDSDFKPPLEG